MWANANYLPNPNQQLGGSFSQALQSGTGPWGNTVATPTDSSMPTGQDVDQSLSALAANIPGTSTGNTGPNSMPAGAPTDLASAMALVGGGKGPLATIAQATGAPTAATASPGLAGMAGYSQLLEQQASQLPALQQQQSSNRAALMQAYNNLAQQQANYKPPSQINVPLMAMAAAGAENPANPLGPSLAAYAGAANQQAQQERTQNNQNIDTQMKIAALPVQFSDEDVKNAMDAAKEGVTEQRMEQMMSSGLIKNPMAVAMQQAQNAGLDTPEGKMWQAYANKLAGTNMNLDGTTSAGSTTYGFPDPTVGKSPGTLKMMQKEDNTLQTYYETGKRFADAAKENLDAIDANLGKTMTGPGSSLIEAPLGLANTLTGGAIAPQNATAYQSIQKNANDLVNNMTALQHVPGMRGSVLQLQTMLQSKPGVDYNAATNQSISQGYRGVLADFDNTMNFNQAYREASPANVIDDNGHRLGDALRTIYPTVVQNGQVKNFDQGNAQAYQSAIDDAIANPNKYLTLAQQIQSGKQKPATNGVINGLATQGMGSQNQAGVGTPSAASIAHLQQNHALAGKFDEAYGAGASSKILGGNNGQSVP